MKINAINAGLSQKSVLKNSPARTAGIVQEAPYNGTFDFRGAMYDINFGGTYEQANKRKFAAAKANFTPEAQRMWLLTKNTAKIFNHSTITHDHVLLAVLRDLNEFINDLNSGSKNANTETQYTTALSFAELIGVRDVFSDKEKRDKIQPVIKKHIKQISKDLKTSDIPKSKFFEPKPNNSLTADLNNNYEILSEASDMSAFLDNIFMMSVINAQDRKSVQRGGNLILELQKASMINNTPEKQKTHLKFYDEKADTLWKNLDLGNDMIVTYEGDNKAAAKHLIASFTNLIKKPGQKYNSLNQDNTEITIFNKDANFELFKKLAECAKKDPARTHIFIANLGDMLTASSLGSNGSSIALDMADADFMKNTHSPNIRMVFVTNKNTYYANTQPGTALKDSLDHYNTLSIPLVNAGDAKEILKSKSGRAFIDMKIQKTFDEAALDRTVEITSQRDGYFPEKAISYLSKVSSYFIDKDNISLEDVEEYEKNTASIEKTGDSQEEFNIIFDTGKTLDDIIGSPMTKAEAQSVVDQILMRKKSGTKGYTTFLDNGGSYGGGRRHTAEAIAGQAQIPMITINASDFALKDIDALSMNAGLSEIKIKKLISTAKTQAEANKNKTAMIFIENFDNFGSDPLYGISSIYERKAFTQLLSEMDNVRKNENINLIIVGSTNRPEYLDENIMKPYKFLDKIIIYSPQDDKDRIDILNYYIDKNGLKIGQNEEERAKIIKNVAETTNYFSVVDLIYLLEKADDISHERKKDAIDKSDFTEAFLQATTGRVSSRHRAEHDDELVASHECGHALTLQIMYNIAEKESKPWHLPDKLNFITLDPRGNFGGAMFPKDSENGQYSFEKIFSELVCDFGGHASENKFYNMAGSWGISQDMSMATNTAKTAVQIMGLGPKTGRISLVPNALGVLDVSDQLRNRIDDDVEVFLKNAEYVSDRIIEEYSDFVEEFAKTYKDKVGTGECIITSEEFKDELEKWKSKLSPQKIAGLDKLEKEILKVIEKTKKGELAN